MNVGIKITKLRKGKTLSQTDFTNSVSVLREMIGRDECGEVMPSNEVAKKIAYTQEVSLDYGVGKAKNVAVDKKTLRFIHDIDDLGPSLKDKLIFLANAVIRDSKTGKAYAN